MKTRLLTITPLFEPPETLSHHLKTRVDRALSLNQYTHIAIVDTDVTVPDEFERLCEKYPLWDIIGTTVVPSSRLYYLWEKTYRVKLKSRIRDCATIYSTSFLNRIGGWPYSETPGTVLQLKARLTIQTDVRVVHNQSFNLHHSIRIQIRDGKSRAMIHYSFWKTLLHSIFRLRPMVLYGYLTVQNRRLVSRINNWLGPIIEE